MTLERLIELALTSNYLDIYTDNDEYTQLHLFENTWKDLLNEELENLQISMINTTPPTWTTKERNELITLLNSYPH